MKQETQLTHLSGLPLPAELGGPSSHALGYQQARQDAPLRRIHRLMRGRYILAIALAVVGAAAGAILGWRSEHPMYRSGGYLQFDPFLTVDVARPDVIMPAFQEYVRTQAHDLGSQRIINEALNTPEWRSGGWKDDLGIEPLRRFSENLTVRPVTGTALIEVAFTDRDPTVAQTGVKAVILAYEKLAPDSSADRIDEKIAQIQKRIDYARGVIKRHQERISYFSEQYGADDYGETIRTLQTRQAQAIVDLTEVQGRRKAAELALKARQEDGEARELTLRELADTDPTGNLAQLLQQQVQAEDDLALMLNTGIDVNHRRAREKQAEIDLIKRNLEARANELRGKVAAILMGPDGHPIMLNEQYLEALRGVEKMQSDLLQQIEQQILRYGKIQTELRTLREQIASMNQDMVNDQKAIDDWKISKALSGKRKIVSYGDRPIKPSDDDRPKMAMAGVILGGGFPLGLLLLIGLLDHRYRYSDDAAESSMSGVTLLGILPNLPDLLTDPGQAAIAAHCVHQIRTMLQVNSGTDEPRCYTLTSASSGDGKTSLCLAMGLSFAASGSRTLLIDADVVGAGLSSRLNMAGNEGILDALAARSLLPFVRTTDIDGLSILPVGAAMGHHASMLAPAAVRRLVAEAKRHFDTVLIDTGPILGSIEASAVAAAADGVVLCVARGQQRPLVEKSLAHLMAIGARLAGVVFNRAQGKDFQDSISRMSARSQRDSRRLGNGNGSTRRDGEHIGPVARAVASSVRSVSGENGHGPNEG